jgi:uncharacterized membrane-anchored protein
MTPRLTPARKLLIIVGIQFLVLLSVIGFKQYTIWTGETVLLRTTPIDPQDLLRGDFVEVRYDISRLKRSDVEWDDAPACCGERVYVELEEQEDGYWTAVAVHLRRRHSRDGTVLIKGEAQGDYAEYEPSTVEIRYGIEQIFVPEGSGGDLPSGRDHTVAVEVKVDRFGNAVPRRFFVDGQPFDLRRR